MEEKEFLEEVREEKVEEVLESMDDYKEEIEKSFHKLREGDLVKGTVIGVADTFVTVDLGTYAEGIVKEGELSHDPRFSIRTDIAIGDNVQAIVISSDNGYGQVLLSFKRADDILAWDFLSEAMEEGEVFRVKIAEAVKSGVITYLKGIRAFIPASGLDVNYVEETSEYVGKTISVRIIEANREDKKLVLSAKSVIREKEAKKLEEKVSNLVVGSVVQGTVERIESYGVFLSLADGVSGLVHISQMADKRIKSPREVVVEGDVVKAMIIGVKEGKVSLSMVAAKEEEVVEVTEDVIPEEYQSGSSLSMGLSALLKDIKL